MILLIWTLTLIALVISYIKDRDKTFLSLKNSLLSLKNLTSGILGMITLVGLILAIVPKEIITNIFSYEGAEGFITVSILGAIVTIPAPIAFPLAGSLFKAGANPAMLASFITTLTMVGLVTAPMEVTYFGKKFTVLRQSLSFIAAVLIGLIMGAIL